MALIGNETLQVLGIAANGRPAATTETTTTAAIAALASNFSNDSPTAVTAIIGTTLTAAQLVTGLLNRTGPSANYTDTTDTAAAIVAAVAGVVGDSFYIDIKNATPFVQTLGMGMGVTFSSSTIIPPNSIGEYLVVISSATAVVFNHVLTVPITSNALEVITSLTTVGAGTITAAGIAGGITKRTGSTAAFTDTTDIADNIIAAVLNAHIGQSFEYTYFNNTAGTATLTGGTGVTVSGLGVIVPQGTWSRFLVTYTAADTVTMVAFATGSLGSLPASQFSSGTTTTTFTAGELTGANYVVYTNTGATPGSINPRTAAQMIGDIPNAYVGQTWTLRVVNGQGTGTLTVATGVNGVTVTGTNTVAANTWRDFICTITSVATPAITIQNVGVGTFS